MEAVNKDGTVITYKFKLKNGFNRLSILSNKVNYIWNYCNQTSSYAIKKDRKILSEFELNNLTAGTSKILNINSYVVQSVTEYYYKSRTQQRKSKLNWRSSTGRRKSLGWVPFKNRAVKINNDNSVIFMKNKYKFIKSREIVGEFKTGCFVQDACGDWYICLVFKISTQIKTNKLSVGIDLGQDAIATTSDGKIFKNPKYTQKYANKLAIAQQSNNKKMVTRMYRKIKRSRIDNLHKISFEISNTYSNVIVGNLQLESNKHTNDASFRGLVTLLKYKVSRLGGTLLEINEAYSTKTCNSCLDESGPSGLKDLAVREWTCESCGQTHQRDINAAKNILVFGYKHLKTFDELPVSQNEESLGGA